MDTGIEFNDAKQLTPKAPIKTPAVSPNKIPNTESKKAGHCSFEDKSASDTFDGPVVIEKVFREMSMFKSVKQYQQIIETVLIEPETMPVEAETVPMIDEDIFVDEIGEKIFGMISSFGSIGAFKQYF